VVLQLGLRAGPVEREILLSAEERSAQDDNNHIKLQAAPTTKRVMQCHGDLFVQARAIVTPQVKPMPADANSNNCPGRISPSRFMFA
jgi:hypothetical protein